MLAIGENFFIESLGMLFVALVLEMCRCFLHGRDVDSALVAMERCQSGFLGFTAHLREDMIRKQVQILIRMGRT